METRTKTEETKGFDIHNTAEIHLSYMDRIRVLFGKPIINNTTIVVDKEVIILESSAKPHVDDIFPKRQKGGCLEMYQPEEPIDTSRPPQEFAIN